MPERTRSRPLLWKGSPFQQFRKKIRVRPPRPITVIDLDGQLLRVVQAGPRGARTAVTRVLAEKLEWLAEADRSDPIVAGQAIARTLSRLRIKHGPVVMGVPRALVVLRSLSLPVIEDFRELASMVHFQISKDLPFPLEEAVIDFTVRRQISPPSAPAPASETSPGAAEVKSDPAAVTAKLE